MNTLKIVVFEGNSRAILSELPKSVRYDLGRQLFRLQEGNEPDDWKPHVLHCFQKKTEKTTLRDIRIASDRFRALKRRIENGKNQKK